MIKNNFLVKIGFIILAILCLNSLSLGEEAAPADQKKPEEGGGGASKKKNEFMEVQGQVAALQAKVKAQNDMVVNLLQHKAHEKNPTKLAEINKELAHAYKELTETNKQYEQKRALFLYRFPEKGLKGSERRYQRIEVKSLQDMEKQVTLDAKIKVSLEKAKEKYHYNKKSEQTSENNSAHSDHQGTGNSNSDSAADNPDNGGKDIPSLTEPIVIRK